ncbi:MAG TPA: hypothetical protein DIC59_03375, partial [Candidatus Competibacteraceae bacterium]|nr:hypothetical protein [Candidatus Competibacteraceae bacterium]
MMNSRLLLVPSLLALTLALGACEDRQQTAAKADAAAAKADVKASEASQKASEAVSKAGQAAGAAASA